MPIITPKDREVPLNIPDNPYTQDVQEGAGGDPIDISWAVDTNGNYVNLNQIDFIKITTANLADLGWLGEVSTDIMAVTDVEPGSVTGITQTTVIYHHAKELLIGDSLQIYARFFDQGKPVDTQLYYIASDEMLATIDSNGLFIAKKGGEVEISVYPEGLEELTRKTDFIIREPTEINLSNDFSSIYPGDSIRLNCSCT